MEKLSRAERSALARKAAAARWERLKNQPKIVDVSIEGSRADDEDAGLPIARYPGILNLNGVDIPVYVLSNRQRVIARIAAIEVLSGTKRQGDLESYIGVTALQPFLNTESILARMVAFRLPGVEMLNTEVKGLPSDLFIEICRGYVAALNATNAPSSKINLTPRQAEIAVRASMFLAACAKVGLDALIDEATGYQYVRPPGELELKLRLYLAEEMRKWEKTFPDQLWEQFGRLKTGPGRFIPAQNTGEIL